MALSVREAVSRVMDSTRPLGTEQVALQDAIGYVVAVPVAARVSLPASADAGMDGYAARANDVAKATPERPVQLSVLETIGAGAVAVNAVGHGQAIRIMTGASLPAGADTVVRVEDTDGGDTVVSVRLGRDAGRNVRPAGEDITAGQTIVDHGVVIAARHLGLLAAVGATHLTVYRRPRVAILASGDELVELGAAGSPGDHSRIVSSNSYLLEALVRDAGGRPVSLGIVPDRPDALHERLLETTAQWDLLITTGGVSVGAFDYTRSEVAKAGVTEEFWRVRMRPGAQLAFGRHNDALWLGMPGNPVSAFVTFEILARAAIRRMLGDPLPFRRPIHVRAAQPISVAGGATFFLRATLGHGADGQPNAQITGPQGSNLQSSLTKADALLIIPEGTTRVDTGEWLQALDLREGCSSRGAGSADL